VRIEAIRSEAEGSVRRLSARVAWEESGRPALDVFFAIEGAPARGHTDPSIAIRRSPHRIKRLHRRFHA
jgi:hypothetical protein